MLKVDIFSFLVLPVELYKLRQVNEPVFNVVLNKGLIVFHKIVADIDALDGPR